MNDAATDAKLATMKFGIGQPVPRTEDPTLLTGQGRYTDDLDVEGQAYGVLVRSAYAHGVLNSIDIQDALTMPGVLGIYTAEDLAAAGFGNIKCGVPLKNRDGSPMPNPTRPALASGKVRFVGDPVAIVVAETSMQARDAAEAVVLDIDPLLAVTDAEAAAAYGAPLLYDTVPNNVILDYHYGDSDAVAKAFAEAAHVTSLDIVNNRIVVSAMEPRAAIAEFDAAQDKWTLHLGCQGVFGLRNLLAKDILRVPPEKVRVLTGNVGGSFGMKAFVYPEYPALFHAARTLGRPVKWTADRSESFLSDQAGRDHKVKAELALDADGHFLAVRVTGFGNMGAYLCQVGPMMPTLNIVKNMTSLYKVPVMEVSTQCVYTNTSPVSAYRGAGRPEGNYYMERLVDTAARGMGIDRTELRRRNHIPASAMPYTASSGMTYDSGEFTAVLDKALTFADYDGFAARKAESAARGLLLGIGIGDYLEVTAPPQNEMGGLRFEEDGTVTIVTGTLDYGQGHAAPFAQVLHTKLGVPFNKVRLLQGDSDQLIAGGGTGGSKSIMASGAAIVQASDKVIEKGKAIAGHLLEAATVDIEFADGAFTVTGTDRSIGIMEIAMTLRSGISLPDGVPTSLDVSEVLEGLPSAFPNGCHVAEVEVDPETGMVRVVRYNMVNDFGTVVNPMLVAGQAHGGIVQGIGQALMESCAYDTDGQVLTGSYMDYAVPRAADAPFFQLDTHSVPATTNPLGAKGCGEAGCAGSLPAVMNALVDALSGLGVTHINMPATPERVWSVIQAA
ncbi:MAG: xanthine dehydrogenase family protein molybdopterin-binding subunit [Alphaproteobacteria bacterium]|nr:xanthine dehydrogenase family protein molybdopterin-binding subunit [Alphaproteobacteria bacterium]